MAKHEVILSTSQWISGFIGEKIIGKSFLKKYFSFIFKDDQPVERSVDPEVVNNPQEPIRIEEKVR